MLYDVSKIPLFRYFDLTAILSGPLNRIQGAATEPHPHEHWQIYTEQSYSLKQNRFLQTCETCDSPSSSRLTSIHDNHSCGSTGVSNILKATATAANYVTLRLRQIPALCSGLY